MKLLPSAPAVKQQTKKISAKSISSGGGESGGHKGLVSVKSRVIKIEKLLGAQNKLYEKQKKKAVVQEEKKTRAKREDRLEKPKDKEEKDSKKLLKGPKLGFLDRVKNFIGKVLIGFIAIKMIKYLPNLLQLIPKIDSVLTWVSNFGMGLVDGFATFVKGAYDLRTKTIKFVKDVGGEDALEKFKMFEGAMEKVITALVFATAAGGKGGIFDAIGEVAGDRLMQKGAQTAATKAGSIGAGAAAGIIGGVGLLSSAIGEGAFQLRGKGRELEGGAKKNYEKHKDKWAVDPRRALSWGMYQAARFGNTMLSTLGFLFDVVGAPFRYAIELIRYPFLSEEGKKKQAKNLAKFDSRIREDVRKALNMVTFGNAFKEKGSFGNIFGDDAAQAEMMSKMSGGGITRGGQELGAVSRQLKSEKKRARPAPTNSQKTRIQPGDSVGGKKDIQRIFPKSDKNDSISPLTYIEGVNKKVSEMPFLGPIFGVAYKTLLGDQADDNDYRNIAGGLDKWTRYTFNLSGSKMKLAGGGEVDIDMLMKNRNMTGVIQKNIKGIISDKVTNALNDLRRQLSLKDNVQQTAGTPGPGSSDQTTSTSRVTISGGDADFWTLVAVASREDGDPQAWADVAQSIYNRLGSGAYTGSTIKELILARMQYEPTWKFPNGTINGRGNPNDEWYAIKDVATAAAAAGMSQDAMKSVAAAILNTSLQDKAREFIQGRTDFRGYSVEGGLTRKAGDNYFGWYNNYNQNRVASVPNFGATATVAPSTSTSAGSGVVPQGQLADMTGGKRNIYLHWSAGNNMTGHPNRYHATFLADGSKVQTVPYTQRTPDGHTSDRNQAIGLAVAGMGHQGWGTMKKSALDAMVAEAAKLAKQMGFSKSEVDRRIWTHAEAGSMLDGGRNRPNSKNRVTPPPAADNYGPYGGDSARVDWMDVDQQSWGQKKGGSVLRSMIKNRMYYGGKVSGAKGQDMIPVMLTHGEFILDVNSTKAMEDNFPGFLDALNRAKYDQAIGVLRNYASYEAGAQQSAQIPMTIINNIIQSQGQNSPGGVMVMSSGSSADDYGEALAAGQ